MTHLFGLIAEKLAFTFVIVIFVFVAIFLITRVYIVHIVESPKREKTGEIALDLAAAGAKFDEIGHHFVAYTGVPGEELALLDVDHKAVLVFNLQGKFVAKSALPATLKLRSQNHINGTGYSNGLFFVYAESEGEFGTYYGYRISDQAR